MGMRLTPAQLRNISHKVEEIDKLGDSMVIKQISMHGHSIFLSRGENGHEVVGFSLERPPIGTSTMRGNDHR